MIEKEDRKVFISHYFSSAPEDMSEVKWANNLCYFLSQTLSRISECKLNLASSSQSGNFKQDIVDSEIAIIIITSKYGQSKQSQEEIKLLSEKYNKNEIEIFKVLKNDIEVKDKYDMILDLPVYHFFDKNLEKINLENFDEKMVYEAERLYWTRLFDLAYDIKNSYETKIKSDKRNIYLSLTNYELQRNRDAIRRELIRAGYNVLPKKNFDVSTKNLKQNIQNDMLKSFSAIHFIGDKDTISSNLENKSIEYFQCELAAEISKNNNDFKRLVWMPSALDIDDNSDTDYIEKIKRDKELLFNADVVQVPIEKFKNVLFKKFLNTEKGSNTLNKHNEDVLYFVFPPEKESEALQEYNHLKTHFKNLSYSDYSGEYVSVLQKHRFNLLTCSYILIYYAVDNQIWLRSKLQEIIKSVGLGRKKGFSLIGIVNTQNNDIQIDDLPIEVKIYSNATDFYNEIDSV